MSRRTCDNASVGVVIEHDHKYLMFDRNTPPAGCAPVAGHVFDDHAGYEEAARAEVAEESGLTVDTLIATDVGGWRNNMCRRTPGPRGIGHEWKIYHAKATGNLAPSTRETRNVRWVTAGDMRALADRTIAYAQGDLTDADFAQAPGLEPVWVRWFCELRVITATQEELALIESLVCRSTADRLAALISDTPTMHTRTGMIEQLFWLETLVRTVVAESVNAPVNLGRLGGLIRTYSEWAKGRAVDEVQSTLADRDPGSPQAIAEYIRTVIEQRTKPNDDTTAERLAAAIAKSIFHRLDYNADPAAIRHKVTDAAQYAYANERRG